MSRKSRSSTDFCWQQFFCLDILKLASFRPLFLFPWEKEGGKDLTQEILFCYSIDSQGGGYFLALSNIVGSCKIADINVKNYYFHDPNRWRCNRCKICVIVKSKCFENTKIFFTWNISIFSWAHYIAEGHVLAALSVWLKITGMISPHSKLINIIHLKTRRNDLLKIVYKICGPQPHPFWTLYML